MTLPQRDLDLLHLHLHNHELALAQLEAAPDPKSPRVKSAIQFHETVLAIGQNDTILTAVDELIKQPQLVDQLAQNPQAFTRQRGIQLPAGGTIMAIRPDPQSVVVGVTYHIGTYHVSLQYDSARGFIVRNVF